jgi:hypothetical protein
MAPTKEAEKTADSETDEQGFPVGSGETASDTTNGSAKAKGGARPKPTYAAEKVTELPTDLTLPRSGPRTDPAFVEALQTAQGDAGEWYCVATFQSAIGARTSLKRIQQKKVTIPAGEWDFEARRIEAPESTEAEPVRWSKLYAKFLG